MAHNLNRSPPSSMILRQQDENIDELQSTLQEAAVSGRENLRPYYYVFHERKIGNAESEGDVVLEHSHCSGNFPSCTPSPRTDFSWTWDVGTSERYPQGDWESQSGCCRSH